MSPSRFALRCLQAVFSGRFDHIIELLQAKSEYAFAIQGLKRGSGNTAANLKWLLVGWDNEPGAEVAGFACALLLCNALFPADSGSCLQSC